MHSKPQEGGYGASKRAHEMTAIPEIREFYSNAKRMTLSSYSYGRRRSEYPASRRNNYPAKRRPPSNRRSVA